MAKADLPYQRAAMVLQGGGALGAYQVGVFEALQEAEYALDWFAGTSIGAINAPDERLANLTRFWERIGWPELGFVPGNGPVRRAYNHWSGMMATWLGQPGFFFRPRFANPWLLSGHPEVASYYDNDDLRTTLQELIDPDIVNSGKVRLSLGAVDVASGRQVYFDSRQQEIRIEHVLASGALPPAFSPVELGGSWSCTPLDVVIDDNPRVSTLVFMVDVFDAAGALPSTMDEAAARQKEITYATRSGRSIEAHRTMHNLRRAVNAMWETLPPAAQADSHLQELARLRCVTTMSIVHILYHATDSETSFMDHDFSHSSIQDRRARGYSDAKALLARPDWLEPPPEDIGVIVYGKI